MNVNLDRKRVMIMKILQEAGSPLSSGKIRERMAFWGMDVSERTIRFHLQALDGMGLTGYKGKKGRFLTPEGLLELSKNHVYDRVGFLSSKIDEMTYRMDFNPQTVTGKVLVNVSLVSKEHRDAAAVFIPRVFKADLAHGTLLALLDSGQRLGDFTVPDGQMGLCTVCSVSFNGGLIQQGIPVANLFGGLLEFTDSQADRFTAIIRYDGTSLDPMEIYIASRMTSIGEAVRTGSGQIGVSFREIPSSAREKVIETHKLFTSLGLGGFLKLGYPGQLLLEIPVEDRRTGMVVSGGLNAAAVLVEEGIPVQSAALSGLMDYRELFPYDKLPARLDALAP